MLVFNGKALPEGHTCRDGCVKGRSGNVSGTCRAQGCCQLDTKQRDKRQDELDSIFAEQDECDDE